MITLKTKEEIALLKNGGRRLGRILTVLVDAARPGISTLELDGLAERLIRDAGGEPVFKGYQTEDDQRPYPASICTSVNADVVHSIPKADQVLADGDVLSIDIGMRWPSGSMPNTSGRGLVTDMAVTVGIGAISDEVARLVRVTNESLDAGIAVVKPGARVGDVSHAVEVRLRSGRYGIIRDLAGHGVGHELHEDPLIPNYGRKGTGIELVEGMVIAIEPMATLGKDGIRLRKDGWTFATADGSLAAHFEKTIAVVRGGAEVLTPFPVVSELPSGL